MRVPNWRTLRLAAGVALESNVPDGRVVIWVPDGVRDGFECWERVASVAGASVHAVGGGWFVVAAAAVRVRRPTAGAVPPSEGAGPPGRRWVLPDGGSAEQWGGWVTDYSLTWADDPLASHEEADPRRRWPAGTRLRRVAETLYVVGGAAASAPTVSSEPPSEEGEPRAVAERWLADARRTGGRRREAAALAELGFTSLTAGDLPDARAFLEDAWQAARVAGEPAILADARANLGLVALQGGDPARAFALFQEELETAETAGDVFGRKNALSLLGLAYAVTGEPRQAAACYEQALTLARQAGDRHHEATLLWNLAIQAAERGRLDEALVAAETCMDLLRRDNRPEAEWFARHWHEYRAGCASDLPGGTKVVAPPATAVPSAPSTPGQGTGPGLLRMALTATTALATFLGAGARTANPEVRRRRLEVCASCPHHTGLRCRLCGCFTAAKARLPGENCPLGNLPC